jgi:hypothetical protein
MKNAITAPEGFTMPEGIKGDEEFEVVASVKMEDGKLHIYKIDGMEVEEMEDEEDDEDDEGEGEMDFLGAIESGMTA